MITPYAFELSIFVIMIFNFNSLNFLHSKSECKWHNWYPLKVMNSGFSWIHLVSMNTLTSGASSVIKNKKKKHFANLFFILWLFFFSPLSFFFLPSNKFAFFSLKSLSEWDILQLINCYRGPIKKVHRHLKIIDCLTARVFFISTVNGPSKKRRKEAYFALR